MQTTRSANETTEYPYYRLSFLTFNVVVVVFDIEFVKPNLGGLVSNGNGAIFVVLDLGIGFLA